MQGEHGESLSWDAYCIRVPELLAYEPFVEGVLPGDLDMALFELGEQHAGEVLSAGDCLSMFDRGTVVVGLVPFEARCFSGFQPPSSRLQSSPCLNGYDTLGATQCEEYGVLGVAHGLTNCPRRVRSEENYGRYGSALRGIMEGLVAQWLCVDGLLFHRTVTLQYVLSTYCRSLRPFHS